MPTEQVTIIAWRRHDGKLSCCSEAELPSAPEATEIPTRFLLEPDDPSIPEEARTHFIVGGVAFYLQTTEVMGDQLTARLSCPLIDNILQVVYETELNLPKVVKYWRRCQACNKVVRLEHFSTCSRLCGECLEKYKMCNFCHRPVLVAQAHSDAQGQIVCLECFRTVASCIRCGCFTLSGTATLCPDCQERDEREARHLASSYGIRSYGYKPNPIFLPKYELKTLYFGVEMETDGYPNRQSVQDAGLALMSHSQFDKRFYLKHDGSLSGSGDGGIEIVSHPATLEFHEKEFGWSEVVEIVKKHKGKSHYTNTCGLHIHFSGSYMGKNTNEKDANCLKLLYLVDKFWPQLLRFSRRDPDRIGACQRHGQRFKELTLRQYQGLKERCQHGTVVNVCANNNRTIEVRLFRGTLNLPTLFASMELVNYLVHLSLASTLSSLVRLSWRKFAEGVTAERYSYFDEYLKFKGLKPREKKKKEGVEECASLFVNEGD